MELQLYFSLSLSLVYRFGVEMRSGAMSSMSLELLSSISARHLRVSPSTPVSTRSKANHHAPVLSGGHFKATRHRGRFYLCTRPVTVANYWQQFSNPRRPGQRRTSFPRPLQRLQGSLAHDSLYGWAIYPPLHDIQSSANEKCRLPSSPEGRLHRRTRCLQRVQDYHGFWYSCSNQ